jgi:hypothetical protein
MIQPSLVPKSPLGRKIKIKTKNKYGKMGATCESVSLTNEFSRAASLKDRPSWAHKVMKE